MRKNKVCRTNLALNCTFKVQGLNLDRFINYVKKQGITIYNAKKSGNKVLIVTVSFNQSQKFFAIAKEMCYNIKKLNDGGRALPLLNLYRMLGIFIGCVLITLTAIFCDDLLLGVSFTGSGSLYKREVSEYLQQKGITTFTRFSSFSTQRLEDEILASNPRLSFVSCKKAGSRLIIELELSKDKVNTLNGNEYCLISDVNGVIENLKVYRGTATFSVGDYVNEGDLIVDGYALIKEQTVKQNVIAWVSVICQSEFIYTFDTDTEKEKALMFAEQQLLDKEIVDQTVAVNKNGEKYDYIVKLSYRHVLCVG